MVLFSTILTFVSAIAAASVDPYSYHQGHSLKNCPQHAIHQQVMAGRTLNRGHVQAKLAQRIPLKAHQSNRTSQKNYNSNIGSYQPKGPSYESSQYGFDIDEMLRQVNQVREKVGAGPLRLSKSLMQAALRHSQDQAKSRRMSHTGSNGSDHSFRCRLAGYKGRGTAENVAYRQQSVTAVMKSWIKSPGHYKNIVNPQYKDFGAAMVSFYWTQNFGSGE
ncbi:hypothetical protein DSO57_1015693 [Entomophthora muscae]|uniref:Uncharacterized protein n=1 Tax=Entomophthora muscae TaxID=34485 RepID=A0ACC2RJM7_9FUNG|nr:hypothetical protein DSO57_1015693 [Entomophthora muscae]